MLQAQFDQLLPQIMQLAQTNPEIDALYLYGSHAKGNANEHSDIDLAVIFSATEENHLKRDPLKQRLRPELLAIDWNQQLGIPENTLSILDLENGPVPLGMAVLKTGKLLINKDTGRDFEVTGKIMSKWEIDHLHHYQHFS
ncbi:MAG: nucleotidyltransferase domain-containing protein [Thalassolituus oleivorans]|uniref:type VII toxin-antitoxin system MntA family adenylyltransferase antitoxin n=1 Tax=Thalassolituus oleivorans TaxID=187493 RepID=UPI001B44AAC6|nr:nucleotidyltransferase domain-containing protein [Thalassolituus oleivorans]MBQ0726850.1 nucleotidyltransferase domain-containing protein [Thalassolituus oleivorans]